MDIVSTQNVLLLVRKEHLTSQTTYIRQIHNCEKVYTE